MSNRPILDPLEATFRDLREAVCTADGRAAMNAIERRPGLDTLQYVGDGIRLAFAQGVVGAARRAGQHIRALRDRDLDGDEDLAIELEDLLAPAYRAIAAAAVRIAGGEPPLAAPPDAGLEAPREADPPARPRRRPRPTRTRPPRRDDPERSRLQLERLIEAATVDCYNESEESAGFFEMINEHLDIPFMTTLLGVAVTVTAVEIADDDRILAVCRRGRDLLRVALLELPMPDPAAERRRVGGRLPPLGAPTLIRAARRGGVPRRLECGERA